MTRKYTRGASAVAAATLALGGALAFPDPAQGAPAPCERADEYAAQSGAQLFRVDRLDGFGSGRISGVGVAEAKSALVADAAVNSAAVTRLLDADKGKPFTDPLIQQAPPTNATAARRSSDPGEIGPFAVGNGALTAHAQWDPRMACGRSAGEVTRAEAAIRGVGIGDLIRAPQLSRSRSTTALASGGQTMAAAGVKLPAFDLLGDALHVKVLRQPSLTARMSTNDSSRIRYVPAVVEVSGDGVRTTRLDAPGDEFELRLDETRVESAARPSTVDSITGGSPLRLPAVRGLPQLDHAEESARTAGPGTRLRITLGNVREATTGHAIAAKATAIRIAITQVPSDGQDPSEQAAASERGNQSPDRHQGTGGYRGTDDRGSDGRGSDGRGTDGRGPDGRGTGGYRGTDGHLGTDRYRGADRAGVVADLGVGLLEAAAVSPTPQPGGVQGVASAGGAGAGLPITGSPVMLVAIGGGALVIAGAAVLAYTSRRRRFRP